MTPEQQAEVWHSLDRNLLIELANQGPQPVFATISGAHLYGFASPDSDVDLRGVQTVGGAYHTEWWVMADDLEELNDNIVGLIDVVRTYNAPASD